MAKWLLTLPPTVEIGMLDLTCAREAPFAESVVAVAMPTEDQATNCADNESSADALPMELSRGFDTCS